jgi:hypothetical protein
MAGSEPLARGAGKAAISLSWHAEQMTALLF